jgi:hypothetical protein
MVSFAVFGQPDFVRNLVSDVPVFVDFDMFNVLSRT